MSQQRSTRSRPTDILLEGPTKESEKSSITIEITKRPSDCADAKKEWATMNCASIKNKVRGTQLNGSAYKRKAVGFEKSHIIPLRAR
jgi:hypothetical protein